MLPPSEDGLESLLHRMIRLRQQRLHTLLSHYNLYPGQPPILRMLQEQDGRTQKEFADRAGVKAATITVMLSRMERAGLVQRRPDPDDLRVTRVYLTPKGTEVSFRIKEITDQLSEACFTGFTTEEKILLRRLFLQMIDNLMNMEMGGPSKIN